MDRHPVILLAVLSALSLGGLAGLLVAVGQRRYRRRVARETRALRAAAPVRPQPRVVVDLPAPVERYRRLAVGNRAPVQTLRLEHHGSFRTRPAAKPSAILGTQLFTAEPPGFLWTGRIRALPGLWFDARDMLVDGKGSMRVLVEDVIEVVDEAGAHIDQGAALRLLAEMVWYPTSLFDGRSVTWAAIDATHARATLLSGSRTVSGIFEFGTDGMPVQFTAERFDDKGVLRGWGGTYTDYRTVSGMRVPFEAAVTWQLDAGPCTYAHWLVDSMMYDEA